MWRRPQRVEVGHEFVPTQSFVWQPRPMQPHWSAPCMPQTEPALARPKKRKQRVHAARMEVGTGNTLGTQSTTNSCSKATSSMLGVSIVTTTYVTQRRQGTNAIHDTTGWQKARIRADEELGNGPCCIQRPLGRVGVTQRCKQRKCSSLQPSVRIQREPLA